MTDFNLKRTWGPEQQYETVSSIPHENNRFITIAGPCSIESEKQIEYVASELSRVDCTYMRGGVYRAGTYPPKRFGLQTELMEEFSEIAHSYNLKTIMEILDVRQVFLYEKYADAYQVGARHMQDYALLEELSGTDKPVTLKRNMGATLDEFLGAAEYLVRKGKRDVMLIERGSSTHMNHVRWDLSISTIAAIKRITGLSILVDASHGTGRRDLVVPMTLAGIAAGADGFLVEVHPEPDKSLSDSDQAITLESYFNLYGQALAVRKAIKV